MFEKLQRPFPVAQSLRPMTWSRSKITADAPCEAAANAAESPAGPLPQMMTSKDSMGEREPNEAEKVEAGDG